MDVIHAMFRQVTPSHTDSSQIPTFPVSKMTRERVSGVRNRRFALWIVLSFQAWKRRWLP